MTRPIPFFATVRDLYAWLSGIPEAHSLAYTLSGVFDNPVVSTFPSVQDIPNFGLSTGNQITDDSYLIHRKELTIVLREIPQRHGGIRFAVDHQRNPHVVGIRFGGMFNSNWIIAGQLGPPMQNPESEDLRQSLAKRLRASFKRIQSYWVGSEAKQALDGGSRLTVNWNASPVYDLRE